MNDLVTRQCVTDFLDAFYAGDAARVVDCCADDFDSITYAPIELFPHLGQQRGKHWAEEAIRIQQQRYASRRAEITFMAVESAKAATTLRVALEKRNDRRVVQFEIADFFTLRDGLIVTHRSFFDSFDLVQQVLGHDLTDAFAASIRNAMRG
jgi:ketosteroid isomerase-like protein